jgi:hypothetical protein
MTPGRYSTLVKRVESGASNEQDAILVAALISALAKMMSYAPQDIRRSYDYDFSAMVLADALDLSRQPDGE